MKKEMKYRMRRLVAISTLAIIALGSAGYLQTVNGQEKENTKKYELVKTEYRTVNNKKLYRIKALKNFGEDIKKGDLGGYVESEKNLSQKGDCWIFDNATVTDNAIVKDNALVCDWSIVDGKSIISGDTVIDGNSQIKDTTITNSNQYYSFKNIYSKLAKHVTYQSTNGLYNVNGILYSEENYLNMMKNENNKAYQTAIANVGMVDAMNDIAIEK